MKFKDMDLKKACIVRDIQIALWTIVVIFCAVILILESASTVTTERLTVKEDFFVSSSLINKAQQNYMSAITGVLYNPTDEVINVERVTVTVKGDGVGREVEIEGFSIAPRMGQAIYEEWEGLDAFSRVTRISATIDGETTVISNVSNTAEQGTVVVLIGLLAFAALLLALAIRGRYYLWQESRL